MKKDLKCRFEIGKTYPAKVLMLPAPKGVETDLILSTKDVGGSVIYTRSMYGDFDKSSTEQYVDLYIVRNDLKHPVDALLYCYNVIATTARFKWCKNCENHQPCTSETVKIPQSFIDRFAEQYNLGNLISTAYVYYCDINGVIEYISVENAILIERDVFAEQEEIVENEITTDCREEIGITVGLIDTIINNCRILKSRNLSFHEVKESLKDLRSDEDLKFLLDER